MHGNDYQCVPPLIRWHHLVNAYKVMAGVTGSECKQLNLVVVAVLHDRL